MKKFQHLFEEVSKPTFLVLTISNPMDSNPQEFWGDMENTYIVYVDECYLDTKKVRSGKITINNYNGKMDSLQINVNETFAIPLGSVLTDESRLGVVESLETIGVSMLNEIGTMKNARNKLTTSRILTDAKLVTPITSIVHPAVLEDAVKTVGGKFPMILKTVTGSQGKGVMKIDSMESLQSVVDAFDVDGKEILLQQYLPIKYDIRVGVLLGEAIFAMRRFKADKDFRTNIKLGSNYEPYRPTPEMIRIAELAAHAMNMRFCGVDIGVGDFGYTIIEVNGSPGVSGKYYSINEKKDIDGRDVVRNMHTFFQDDKNWTKKKVEIGVIEPVKFEWGEMLAKMDTGNAGSSTLDARNLKVTKNNRAIFKVGETGKTITLPVDEFETVQGAVGTDKERRPVVTIPMTFRKKEYPVRFSLADRGHMNYPVLMGTGWMQKNGFVVNPDIRNEPK